MEMVIEAVKQRLDPNFLQQLSELSAKTSQTTEAVLEQIINQSSYSLLALQRMTKARFDMVIASPAMLSELKRILWREIWASPEAKLA